MTWDASHSLAHIETTQAEAASEEQQRRQAAAEAAASQALAAAGAIVGNAAPGNPYAAGDGYSSGGGTSGPWSEVAPSTHDDWTFRMLSR